jgi:hypothetical protein
MAAAKRFRWECPEGKHPGVLAPSRLRQKDVRRYCLPCSTASGVLVERTCSAVERKRSARRESVEEKRRRAKERQRDQAASSVAWDGVDLRSEMLRLCRLPCVPKAIRDNPPTMVVRHCKEAPRSRTGVCWPWRNHFQVSVWPGRPLAEVLKTVAHEIAHLVDYRRRGTWRQAGKRTRAIHGDSFDVALGEVLLDGYGAPDKRIGGDGIALARAKSPTSAEAPNAPQRLNVRRVGANVAAEVDNAAEARGDQDVRDAAINTREIRYPEFVKTYMAGAEGSIRELVGGAMALGGKTATIRLSTHAQALALFVATDDALGTDQPEATATSLRRLRRWLMERLFAVVRRQW